MAASIPVSTSSSQSATGAAPQVAAVCVAGMHRSGTSMITRLLHVCGLHLGDEDQMLGPQADNPRGFWENRQFVLLNDAILSYLGGGWDLPPVISDPEQTWQQVLALFGDEAADLVAGMPADRTWGWKDPRTSLTLPFWYRLLPGLHTVVCVRHPRAVAASLQRRNGTSLPYGRNLWLQYHRRLQQAVQGRPHIVTHYESFFTDPEVELNRLLAWLGWSADRERVARACATIDASLRHCRGRSVHLPGGAGADHLRDTYAELCREAGPVHAVVRSGQGSRKYQASLVMLTHNALPFTRQCVASILAHTRPPYELICVDNGSTDGTPAYLASLANQHRQITLLAGQHNLGFAGGNNRGLAIARGHHVVLINNDIVVTPGWLERLQDCSEQADNIGIVGPMTNNISGPQQLPRVGYNTRTLEGLDAFACAQAARCEGIARPYWRAVGFCMLIKREVVDVIGGLDERFERGNFEDDDFCLRALLAGYETWLAADCFVHHHGSQSFIAAGVDRSSCLQANWTIFKQKWGIPASVPYGASYDLTPHLERLRGMDLIYQPLPGGAKSSLTAAAETLWRAGKKEVAIAHLTRVLRIHGAERQAVWQLGQYLHELGHLDKATRLYTGYLLRHPHDESMQQILNFWRGDQASPSASRLSSSRA